MARSGGNVGPFRIRRVSFVSLRTDSSPHPSSGVILSRHHQAHGDQPRARRSPPTRSQASLAFRLRRRMRSFLGGCVTGALLASAVLLGLGPWQDNKSGAATSLLSSKKSDALIDTAKSPTLREATVVLPLRPPTWQSPDENQRPRLAIVATSVLSKRDRDAVEESSLEVPLVDVWCACSVFANADSSLTH